MYYPMNNSNTQIPVTIKVYYNLYPIAIVVRLPEEYYPTLGHKIFFTVNDSELIKLTTFYNLEASRYYFPLKISLFSKGTSGYRLLSRVSIPHDPAHDTHIVYIDSKDLIVN